MLFEIAQDGRCAHATGDVFLSNRNLGELPQDHHHRVHRKRKVSGKEQLLPEGVWPHPPLTR